MKKFLIALIFVGINSLTTLAQETPSKQNSTRREPSAQRVGELMAQEMCNEILSTGELYSNSQYERIYDQLITEYGEEATQTVFTRLIYLFDQPGDVAAADPYVFQLFQTTFQNLTENEPCFREFLANEVWGS